MWDVQDGLSWSAVLQLEKTKEKTRTINNDFNKAFRLDLVMLRMVISVLYVVQR
jgi:hypothetical protein